MSYKRKRTECKISENEILVQELGKMRDRFPDGNNVRWTYQRAINSIRDFEFIIKNEKIAKPIKYIGDGICKIIKKTLIRHNQYDPNAKISDQPQYIPPTPVKKQRKSRKKKAKTQDDDNNNHNGNTNSNNSNNQQIGRSTLFCFVLCFVFCGFFFGFAYFCLIFDSKTILLHVFDINILLLYLLLFIICD